MRTGQDPVGANWRGQGSGTVEIDDVSRNETQKSRSGRLLRNYRGPIYVYDKLCLCCRTGGKH